MNRKQFLTASGLEAATLEVWTEQSWIIPRKSGGAVIYSEIDLARAHLIRELSHDIGANDAGIDIILHLIDQLHDVRRALADARELGGAAPAKPTARRNVKPKG